MYWACADLITLASQLGSGASISSATAMRSHIAQLFSSLQARTRAAGIAHEDSNDAAYAIMALLDEILVQTNWPGRMEWQAQPLQFLHFHENIAGENFFRRLETLMRQPHRAHVLLVYFLCLAVGFQGRYAMGGGAALASVYEAVGLAVVYQLPPSDPLSPHGEPADAVRSLFQREAPIVRVALAFFVLALVVFAALRFTLSLQVDAAVRAMHDYATSPKP